jgi:hypothetical protein
VHFFTDRNRSRSTSIAIGSERLVRTVAYDVTVESTFFVIRLVFSKRRSHLNPAARALGPLEGKAWREGLSIPAAKPEMYPNAIFLNGDIRAAITIDLMSRPKKACGYVYFKAIF